MSEVTQLLTAIGEGDLKATAELFPLVYEELKRLARARMADERAEHTLQATALVHEAYLRLTSDEDNPWDNRGHFFAAAAEAMRRILIEYARSKNAVKRGGNRERIQLDDCQLTAVSPPEKLDELLALDEALTKFAAEAPDKAELVKLRYFAGLSVEESAAAMGISPATAKRYWAFARAWLYKAING
ncbi:MAG TPA: sigma-70 family RNA polymerase sigma factor [Pirellulales bacterium]|jgi:RNA polymerase sigma factor (TIGR02999 family)|nr:sigma-70 family RNA polymerase sigma factor [Pirellulales bacterium]